MPIDSHIAGGAPGGFWSYVRADDDADGGRILALARDVVAEYEMLAGETIDLFLDRDSIDWGDNWTKKVDAGLLSALFFIPVLTPRYFQSSECRRELRKFADQATQLGVKQLLLPLLYVDIEQIRSEAPADNLMGLVRGFNWEDWTELRYEERSSRGYRSAVSRLARRLVEANRSVERAEATVFPAVAGEQPTDDEEGTLDLLVKAHDAMGGYSEALIEFSSTTQQITDLMLATKSEIEEADQRGAAIAGRLVAARRLALALDVPVDRIATVTAKATSQLHDIDSGVRVIIEALPAEARENPDALTQACDFFKSVRTLARSSREMAASMRGPIDSAAQMEKLSRDLRPRLRKLRQALTVIIEGQEVIQDWVRLTDESPIQCPDQGPEPD